jgi:hypothetical protein
MSDRLIIASVQAGESHAFSAVMRHVETVIPIGVFQADDVVLAHIEELNQVLNKHVFENRAFVNIALRSFDQRLGRRIAGALIAHPFQIEFPAAPQLRVAEIRHALHQQIPIAGLI